MLTIDKKRGGGKLADQKEKSFHHDVMLHTILLLKLIPHQRLRDPLDRDICMGNEERLSEKNQHS